MALKEELENRKAELYEIGAVSRLTGLSSPNIRIWEKRYGVVQPSRTPKQRRVYTKEDIRRLTLLKNLVDEGHSIARVANLSIEELEDRLRQSAVAAERAISGGTFLPVEAGRCRVVVVGGQLGAQIREAPEFRARINPEREFENLAEALASGRLPRAELCLVECATLFPETIDEVQELVARARARRAIVIYGFSQMRTVRRIDKDIPSITALRAPVAISELKLACLADFEMAGRGEAPAPAEPKKAGRERKADREKKKGGIPDRIFTDRQLVEVSKISPTIQCECPHHLSSLLSGLAAFEEYSAACEDRNPGDAEMHAFLHECTAQARVTLEHALEDLLEAEGIEIS